MAVALFCRPGTVYGTLKSEASAASLKSLVARRRWDGKVTRGVIRTLPNHWLAIQSETLSAPLLRNSRLFFHISFLLSRCLGRKKRKERRQNSPFHPPVERRKRAWNKEGDLSLSDYIVPDLKTIEASRSQKRKGKEKVRQAEEERGLPDIHAS